MSREVRLQKFIADCGVTSRRKAEDLITEGRVRVNGQSSIELGTKVDPSSDVVEVDGQAIDLNSVNKVYIVMHKPRGCVTTLNDPEGRPTVMDYVQEVSERIYPVGRLDYLSEGLLLLTNDGDLANLIMHPTHRVQKVYEVKVFGSVDVSMLKKLREGVHTEVGFLKPLSVRVIKQLPNKTWLEFRLEEGRNREIRRVCESTGLTVDKLKRVAIERLTLEGIRPGGYRFVTKKLLMDLLGLNQDGTTKSVVGKTYFSSKKTVNLRKKSMVQSKAKSAEDKRFYKFRREHYFKTLKNFEELQKIESEAERQKILAEKNEARKKRAQRKALREKQRKENKSKVHAQFL